MAVTAAFSPLSLQALLDANGQPIVGGSIYVYQAGTTSLITTFANAAMSVANPNPLTSDGFGRIPPIYVGAGAYKIVAQDASGAQLFVVDNLPGGVDYVAQAAAAAQQAGTALATAQTGDVKFKHGSSTDAGWLPLNGGTIGSGATQATSRANADTQALFVYLWNADASLAVAGGRGATATADFNAAKTITLPDYRGRMLAGCDQMGGAATAGVITGASTATPNQVGTKFGAETVTLGVGQLPAFTPQITISGSGTHTHTATNDSQGAHNHSGSTGMEGAHTHTYFQSNSNNVGGGSSGLANNSGNPGTTGPGSNHNHAISIDGAHIHNITIDGGAAGGSHTHTATANSIGGGAAHSNMPPAILGYFHIKL